MTAGLTVDAVASVRAPRLARRRRYALVCGVLAAAVVLVALTALSVGDISVSFVDVVRVLLGGGDRRLDLLVLEFRLPRVVMALVAGPALALAGALFQSVLRNTLASPDILGVTGGASVATVAGTLLIGTSGLAISGLAFAGAVTTALLIYLLSRGGGASGQSFVLVGVGMAFLVAGALGYVLTRAEVQQAQVALAAIVGGVDDATWTADALAAGGLGILLVVLAAAAPTLRILQLSDDTADGLGVPAARRAPALLALAVAFSAVGVAGAGPLAFVAFVSAPIARRLLRDGSPALVPAALVGALVVLVADLVGQHYVPGGTQLPAGVLTGAVGAPYLLYLLTRLGPEGAER